MKKKYIAPSVELVCFAPEETIASWKKEQKDTWTFYNLWGIDQQKMANASVTGVLKWYDVIGKDENGNDILGNLDLD